MKNSSTVRLNITGYGSGDKWPLPADFVFAVDSSGSMEDNKGNNLCIETLNSFIDKLNYRTSWNNQLG
jgi:hypothetical protein